MDRWHRTFAAAFRPSFDWHAGGVTSDRVGPPPKKFAGGAPGGSMRIVEVMPGGKPGGGAAAARRGQHQQHQQMNLKGAISKRSHKRF